MANKYESLPPTPQMTRAGLSFGGLIEFARKAVRLLQESGDDFVDLLDASFRMWEEISGRNLGGILAAFSDAQRSVEKIIAAIRAEFEI